MSILNIFPYEIIHNILSYLKESHEDFNSILVSCKTFNIVFNEIFEPDYYSLHFFKKILTNNNIHSLESLIRKKWFNYNIVKNYPDYYHILFENNSLELFKHTLEILRIKSLRIFKEWFFALIDNDHYDFLKYILENSKFMFISTKFNSYAYSSNSDDITTLFRRAFKRNNVKIVELLFKFYPRYSVLTKPVIDKFIISYDSQDFEMVKALLTYPSYKFNSKLPEYFIHSVNNFPQVFEYLVNDERVSSCSVEKLTNALIQKFNGETNINYIKFLLESKNKELFSSCLISLSIKLECTELLDILYNDYGIGRHVQGNYSLIYRACAERNKDLVRSLIKDESENNINLALNYCYEHDDEELLDILYSTDKEKVKLMNVIKNNDRERYEQYKDSKYLTSVIYLCCEYNNKDLFIERVGEKKLKSVNWTKCLNICVEKGNLRMVKIIIKNYDCDFFAGAFEVAMKNENFKIVEMMMKIKQPTNQHLLYVFSKLMNNENVLKYFVDKLIVEPNDFVELAVKSGKIGAVKALRGKFEDIEHPFYLACKYDKLGILKESYDESIDLKKAHQMTVRKSDCRRYINATYFNNRSDWQFICKQ